MDYANGKTMTQEEKAKAYDEAIEKARKSLKTAKLFDYKEEQIAHDIRETVYSIFPELKESEDERIRKTLIEMFSCIGLKDWRDIPTEKIIVWLEKQGGQKVEPKFHEGDWVVDSQGLTHQIERVVENVTTHTFGYDIVGGGYFNDDSDIHLWTIKDAKTGDVLAEDSCIFIIQKLDDNSTAAKTYCTLYDDGDFDDGTVLYFDIDSTKPATKEQRDLFFTKMKEAGYEWDAKMKEPKKIEQNIGWSEEDEKFLNQAIEYVNYALNDEDMFYNGASPIINWLKSIKQRIKDRK